MNLKPILLALCLVLAALGCSRSETASLTVFHGARLGMALRDVRDRFEPPAPNGTWNTETHDGLTVLTWAASPTAAPAARFEFHNGMLVAVRAELAATDPLTKSDPVSVSAAAVASRTASTYTLIAKDCPVHRAEVESILARARN